MEMIDIENKKSKTDNNVEELNGLEKIETEVRITSIEVNNDSKANGYKQKNIQLKESMNYNIEEPENFEFKKWDQK